jgi:hypothetical protein
MGVRNIASNRMKDIWPKTGLYLIEIQRKIGKVSEKIYNETENG